MMARKDQEYATHKKEVREILLNRKTIERTNTFMNFYSNRYDKYDRSFIDYKLAYRLIDDYHRVKKLGTIVYGIVGEGGTGKSTFLKNILYFLSPEFNNNAITTDLLSFVKVIDSYPKLNALKSVGLDEPDDGLHFSSNEGKRFRKIIGKWRQQQLFIGICATDPSDIPAYLFRKLHTLFFLPYHRVGYEFRNIPRKGIYLLQELKNAYKDRKGYGTFFEYMKKHPRHYFRFETSSLSPLDIDKKSKEEYLENKSKDYDNDIKGFITMVQKKEDKENIKPVINKVVLTDIQQQVLDLLYDGKNVEEIANIRKITTRSVFVCIKGIKKKGFKIDRVYEGGKVTHYKVLSSLTSNDNTVISSPANVYD